LQFDMSALKKKRRGIIHLYKSPTAVTFDVTLSEPRMFAGFRNPTSSCFHDFNRLNMVLHDLTPNYHANLKHVIFTFQHHTWPGLLPSLLSFKVYLTMYKLSF
jgi:hypothetical protein